MTRCPPVEEFQIGWITALPVELAAAQATLDEEYDNEDGYITGRIGRHNIVIIYLPAGQIGTTSAATAAAEIQSRFPSLYLSLMVGVGGGVPSDEVDIRLGDVVISQPQGEHGGVVQFDFGKTGSEGRWTRTGHLNTPHDVLLKAVTKMRSNRLLGRCSIRDYLSSLGKFEQFDRANAGPDVLFRSDYDHVDGATCDNCDKEMTIPRPLRSPKDEVVIHYGTIASGNQVMKDAQTRDRLSAELGGVLCFEMEAAGLMNSLRCLVIGGICDYSDSHKNKQWQPFAAAAAAACAKQILAYIPSSSNAIVRRECQLQQRIKELELQLTIFKSQMIRFPAHVSFNDLVVLNDALGETHCFSLNFVNSTEALVHILKSIFEDVGSEKIERKEWLLQDHHSGRVLDLNRPWGKLVKPGQILDMSMIFRQRHATTLCPWCHSENDSAPDTLVKCSTCSRTYHRVEEINEITIQETKPPNQPSSSPSSPSAAVPIEMSNPPTIPQRSPKPRPPRRLKEEEDISLYTRVQLINTNFRQTVVGQVTSAVRQLTLTSGDLEDVDGLGEYLASVFNGLSEEECLAALAECGIQLEVAKVDTSDIVPIPIEDSQEPEQNGIHPTTALLENKELLHSLRPLSPKNNHPNDPWADVNAHLDEMLSDSQHTLAQINEQPTKAATNKELSLTSIGKKKDQKNEPTPPNVQPGDWVLPIHDFDARSSDEMNLRRGEKVEIIELDEGFDDGWYLGRDVKTGDAGLFPAIYTVAVPKDSVAPTNRPQSLLKQTQKGVKKRFLPSFFKLKIGSKNSS